MINRNSLESSYAADQSDSQSPKDSTSAIPSSRKRTKVVLPFYIHQGLELAGLVVVRKKIEETFVLHWELLYGGFSGCKSGATIFE